MTKMKMTTMIIKTIRKVVEVVRKIKELNQHKNPLKKIRRIDPKWKWCLGENHRGEKGRNLRVLE
jgi:hypothetical protein